MNINDYITSLDYEFSLGAWSLPVIVAMAAKAPSFEDAVQSGLLAAMSFTGPKDGQVHEVSLTYAIQQAVLGASRREAEAGVANFSDLAPEEDEEGGEIVLGSLSELGDFTEMFDEVGDPLAKACDRLIDALLNPATHNIDLLMARKVYGLVPYISDETLLEQYNAAMDAHKKELRTRDGRAAAEFADEVEDVWFGPDGEEDGDPTDCLRDYAFFANLADNPGAGGPVAIARDEWDTWAGWETKTRRFFVAPFGEKTENDREIDEDAEAARELGIGVDEMLDAELNTLGIELPTADEAKVMLAEFMETVHDDGPNYWNRASFTRARIQAILQGYGPEASKTIAFAANSQRQIRPFTVSNIVKVNGKVLFVTAVETYTVTQGDTPHKIAAKFGIGVDSLMSANDRIAAGQKIVIPSRRVPVDRNQWPAVNVSQGKSLGNLAAALKATGDEQATLLARSIEQIRL